MEELEGIENELKESYRARRIKQEAEIIEKIAEDPNNFYRYANKFKIDRNGIGTLKDGDLIAEDDKSKSELLQKQYCSVWSKPNITYDISNNCMTYGIRISS